MQIITNQFQKEIKEHGSFDFPFLISYEKLSRYETGSFLWHWHNEIEITLITKGEMLYQVNHMQFHLKAGDMIFCNSSALHTGSMISGKDCEYTPITFDAKLIYGYENSLLYHKYCKPILQNPALSAIHFDSTASWHKEILNHIHYILTLGNTQPALYEVEIVIHLTSLWKLIYQHTETLLTSTPVDIRNLERIQSLLSYIDTHYSDSISLSNLACHVHLCEEECSRMFKTYMKVSLFSFLGEYRIKKSLDYLLTTKLSITEISEMVGYHDPNYYAKAFRKQIGCSPSHYRKNNKL